MRTEKKIIVSVTNDLATDQRVHKVCLLLEEMGFQVLLVGRKLKGSLPLNRSYQTHRMRLWFRKGALFYAEYNLRLFFFLLFRKANVLLSNDLDTLLPNYLISKLKRKPLVYDTHEYFTGVPEIQHRPFVKKTWEAIEGFIFPKLSYVFTVSDPIAQKYYDLYGKELIVVRNISQCPSFITPKSREELGLPLAKKIVLTQGSGINVDRGIEEAVEAMRYVEDALLLIIGSGDVIPQLKQMVKQWSLEERVRFIDRLPYEDLVHYTPHASVGLTLDKLTNPNYQFSLPNKLFDYIHARVPVLASRVAEVRKIVEAYEIGLVIDTHDPRHIAEKIRMMLTDAPLQKKWKQNLEEAAGELNWAHEKKKLEKVYKGFLAE